MLFISWRLESELFEGACALQRLLLLAEVERGGGVLRNNDLKDNLLAIALPRGANLTLDRVE
jgi:hypothetical protein